MQYLSETHTVDRSSLVIRIGKNYLLGIAIKSGTGMIPPSSVIPVIVMRSGQCRVTPVSFMLRRVGTNSAVRHSLSNCHCLLLLGSYILT
jgi:hypothetical protein